VVKKDHLPVSSVTMAQRPLLQTAAALAVDYFESLRMRGVAPTQVALERLRSLDRPLPDGPADPMAVLQELHAVGSPATMATTGGRFFGFVVGGTLPTALAASWLATAWDQDAGLTVLGPGAAALEEVALRWLLEPLDLPTGRAGGFVTGATMANFTALAAARHALLQRAGWDVEGDGLFGAPPITVVVGQEVHVSVLKALGLLGLGRNRVVRVPTDAQGRMRTDRLPPVDDRTIVCLQAGNVNTGASDPVRDICRVARADGAWVHVDGAFGLWAAAAPARAHLVAGVAEANSWALDGHKWLNVPYDSGVALCRDAAALRAAMATQAAYLVQGDGREPDDYTPELSRRARGVEIWAALAALGRSGLANLVERCCRHATRFADGLRVAGYDVLNEVTLNQVLVSFGDDAATDRVIAGLQADGTCWCGGTEWQGRSAMCISVSSWATTERDVEESLGAMIRIARSQKP
jgi:glutamate/tyrosine decarboxylase-like PLP-dependent enzyme